MYNVIVFNLKRKGVWRACLARIFGGEIPCVPGVVTKNTCLIAF